MLNLSPITDLQTVPPASASATFADNFLRIALDIGEGLLKSGAEVWRVELTIEKICKSYGAEHVEVFSINSVIVATVRMEDGQFSNQVRRILDISNHLICLEEYNSLSRYICENKPPIEEVDARIKKIKEKRKSSLLMDIVGHILAAGSFAVFFGGSIKDGICAGIIAISVALLSRLHFDYFNKMVRTIMMSFVAATLACGAVAMGLSDSMDMINIGTIMTLIPGVYLGNAMRDLLCGDTLSGTLKIVQSVITAVMIAIGYAIPIFIFGGLAVESIQLPLAREELMPIVRLITGTIGTAGFSIVFKMKLSRLTVACVGGFFTCAAYELAYLLTPTVIIAAFVSAVFMALFSEIAARGLKAPAVIFIFPCLIPIVPGRALYYSIYHLLMSTPTEAASSAKVALMTVLGIAVGLGVASIFIGISLQIINAIKNRSVERK